MRSYFLVSHPLSFNKALDFLQEYEGQETEYGKIVNLLSWQIVPYCKGTEFFIVVIRVEVQSPWEKAREERTIEGEGGPDGRI